MPHYFQRRVPFPDLPVIINHFSFAELRSHCPATFFKYSLARRRRYPDDLHDAQKWPALPAGCARTMAGMPFVDLAKRKTYTAESVSVWLTDDMLNRIAEAVRSAFVAGASRHERVALLYPFPIDGATTNITTCEVARQIAVRLLPFLSKNDIALPIVTVTNESCPDTRESLYMIARGKRGKTNENEVGRNQEYGQKLILVAKRLAVQPCFSGAVDNKALYVLIDDGVMAQSTMRNLYDAVASRGTVASAVLLRMGSRGTKYLAITDETYRFAETSLRHLSTQDTRWLAALLRSIGSNLGTDRLTGTLTNQEMLILGAYFADPDDEDSLSSYELALQAIGDAAEEDLSHRKIRAFSRGTVSELAELFERALQERHLLEPRRVAPQFEDAPPAEISSR